jgi:hypothetical protein
MALVQDFYSVVCEILLSLMVGQRERLEASRLSPRSVDVGTARRPWNADSCLPQWSDEQKNPV